MQATTDLDLDHPCPWWSATDARAHRAWLDAPLPVTVAFENLDPCVQWSAGQPVLLRTDGHQHFAYVRLRGFAFGPRWLFGSIQDRKGSPAELTMRDPRLVWNDPYELQVAQALLSAEHDPRLAWLSQPDQDTEPCLSYMLFLAQEELADRHDAVQPAGPAPTPNPKARRGWTRAEIEALRMPRDTIESVDLAPGR